MKKDFWPKSTVAVVGGGSWGTVLAHLISKNCTELHLWVRSEEMAREINSTRISSKYAPQLKLRENIKVFFEIDRFFERDHQAIIWAVPSKACRELAKKFSPRFRGDEILLHATKGVEEGTMKRTSEVLREEIPCPRIGVISGPNLAAEIAKGEPTATIVASRFGEVVDAGHYLLSSSQFRVYGAHDIVGVEWAGTLKNVLAIAAGVLDAMGFGRNSRAMLISRGLAEMVRFGTAMGAEPSTFLGLAGVGDLLATCSSPLSRNYTVGYGLGQGKKIDEILANLGSTAEGVRTAKNVWAFAKARGIVMPITEIVAEILNNNISAKDALDALMSRPAVPEFFS